MASAEELIASARKMHGLEELVRQASLTLDALRLAHEVERQRHTQMQDELCAQLHPELRDLLGCVRQKAGYTVSECNSVLDHQHLKDIGLIYTEKIRKYPGVLALFLTKRGAEEADKEKT